MEQWREPTHSWLVKNGVQFKDLLMRPKGDYRKDRHVKQEILESILRQGYLPIAAIDDNPAIIELWKEYGIPAVEVPGWITEEQHNALA